MQRTDPPRRRRLMYQRLVFTRSRSFARRTERLSISMRWSAWIPVRRPGLHLTRLTPRRHNGRGSGQCRVCHRQLQSLTDGVQAARHRERLKLLDCRRSSPCRELGPSSGWTPPSCGGPMTRSSASSLVDVVWRMGQTPSV